MSFLSFTSRRNLVPAEHQVRLDFDLELESGAILPQPLLTFQTWGTLAADRRNVVWVCHALTGNHRVHEWWGGLFGPGNCFDPEKHFIVCVNVPGSCYGSTGPLSFRSEDRRWFRSFPQLTVRDMVKALEYVRIFLEIEHISVLIGASLGGQQVLEWAVQQPELFGRIIPIATNVQHSPFGIAFNEAQRLAIQADPSFFRDEFCGGRNGLIAARSIAMLSYRTYDGYALTQSEQTDRLDGFRAASYQQYQGEKLANRFNAYSYWYLSKAMDSHNLSRGRASAEEQLAAVTAPTLVVGIASDQLFPLSEQEFIARHLPNGRLATIASAFGHDGFLVEYGQLASAIQHFLEQSGPQRPGRDPAASGGQLSIANSNSPTL